MDLKKIPPGMEVKCMERLFVACNLNRFSLHSRYGLVLSTQYSDYVTVHDAIFAKV